MHISWQGFNYFRLQNNQITILFNPYAWDDNTTFSKVKADLVLFSDPKHFAANKVSEQAFIISSPGEYEVKDVFVYGQQLNGANIFLLSFEDVKIAFLGEFGHQTLSTKDLELIEGCDILILPIGGGELTTAKEAAKIINQVEPRVVIPSAFAGSVGKLSADPLDLFLKEFGVKAQEEEKFKVTKKDLPQEDIKLVVLKAQK
ncbi:MBL fold metallo-hydrolase [Patescibacteria group bacterium]|jgi:L-ascorbate metabolism protein UlaG (beta-lactamase superfamily)|nr:MBL fold metallo-hydrolase [Patescibacteria group bacterium]